MQERQLPSRPDAMFDSTPFKFDDTTLKKFKEAVGNFVMALKTFQEQEADGSMTVGYKHTLASCMEMYVKDITSAMGVDGMLKEESEEKYKEIRALNEENRKLRSLLGDKVTNEDLRERIKNIEAAFSKWWNTEGFGLASDMSFSKYNGLKAILSGHIFESHYDESEQEPKQRADALKAKGFDIANEKGGGTFFAAMTEKNFTLLCQMLQAKYPSAKVIKIDTSNYRHQGHIIRNVEIIIPDLNDFHETPVDHLRPEEERSSFPQSESNRRTGEPEKGKEEESTEYAL